ncbi:MAG: YeeE/YedE family protein [Calditrichaeota bacterium]|nr:YeeE/YedE family protein [Calditrichota bacterium]
MIKVIILGFLFGIILQRSRVNTFEKIGGFAMLKDFTVPKILLASIATSAILLLIEMQFGAANLHVKPFILGGIIVGGILFGIGMATLGYCPGTLIVSIGEGRLDAIIGTIFGLIAGWIYILIFPSIKSLLGPNLGKINLYSGSTVITFLIVLLYSAVLFYLAFYLDKKESQL